MLLSFNVSMFSLPLENRTVHSGGGQLISWSLSHDHLFATTGRPGSLLKVFYLRTNTVKQQFNFNDSED